MKADKPANEMQVNQCQRFAFHAAKEKTMPINPERIAVSKTSLNVSALF